MRLRCDVLWGKHKVDHNSNRAGFTPCLICGKGIRNDAKRIHWLRVGEGGSHLLTEDEPEDAGEMGCWPVGSDCWKKHPELHAFEIDAEG